jgi:hypothetical protein
MNQLTWIGFDSFWPVNKTNPTYIAPIDYKAFM